MKKATTLFLFVTCLVTNVMAQLSTIIDEFIPAYQSGDQNFVKRSESKIYYLKGTEKSQAERIITLFNVLTAKEQSMNIIDFNHATRQVGLSYYNVLQMNAYLNLVQVSSGNKISFLVFNKGEDTYTFSLQGSGGLPSSSYNQNFNGGVYEYQVRIVSYGKEKYKYRVNSIKKLGGI